VIASGSATKREILTSGSCWRVLATDRRASLATFNFPRREEGRPGHSEAAVAARQGQEKKKKRRKKERGRLDGGHEGKEKKEASATKEEREYTRE